MTTGPMVLVSKSARSLLPYWHGPLGQLFTPRMLTGLDITEGSRIRWAADNDGFQGFDQDRYLHLLDAITYRGGCRGGCLFVAAPDVVGDATATMALFERWHPILQRVWATVDEDDVEPGQPIHQPIALVAQDGLERLPVPWEEFQALFVGGSTQWKLGPHAADLIRHAKERGKWVHVGRVNTLRRIRWFMALEVDSIDGSGFARFTRARLPVGMAALSGPTQGTLL
jgi:hypothetical protein